MEPNFDLMSATSALSYNQGANLVEFIPVVQESYPLFLAILRQRDTPLL